MITDLSTCSVEQLQDLLAQTRRKHTEVYLAVTLTIDLLEDPTHPVYQNTDAGFMSNHQQELLNTRNVMAILEEQIATIDPDTVQTNNLIRLIQLHNNLNAEILCAHSILMNHPIYAGQEEATTPIPIIDLVPPATGSVEEDTETPAEALSPLPSFDHVDLLPPYEEELKLQIEPTPPVELTLSGALAISIAAFLIIIEQ